MITLRLSIQRGMGAQMKQRRPNNPDMNIVTLIFIDYNLEETDQDYKKNLRQQIYDLRFEHLQNSKTLQQSKLLPRSVKWLSYR